jgi:hypothetical protein
VRSGNGEEGNGSDEEVDVEPPFLRYLLRICALVWSGSVKCLSCEEITVASTRLMMLVHTDSILSERERELLSITSRHQSQII